jgi:BirA family transcriptional regulator, biotin operon repressor / biotin---[acetyl-CoA-carboxylase] ligase
MSEDPRLPPVYRLVALDSVGSTNDEAKTLARAGAEEGTIVWAREQTAGRGRQGREWTSPRGNLYLSLILRPECPASEAAQLAFVACLGVGGMLGAFATPLTPMTYKWPNDVLLGGRKVAGVLLEAEGKGDGLDFLVVGVGVNLASAPKDARHPATDLRSEAENPVSPEQALESFARHFLTWVSRWTNDGFATVREAWLARAAHLGKEIEVRLPNETVAGIFAELGPNGELLLDTSAGRRIVTAGDVHLPGIG